MVKAIIKDKKILCPRCLNKLMELEQRGKDTKLIIICKARKNGVNCNTISSIEL